jgi:hypothetical protein
MTIRASATSPRIVHFKNGVAMAGTAEETRTKTYTKNKTAMESALFPRHG